jgi:hypothetical protein
MGEACSMHGSRRNTHKSFVKKYIRETLEILRITLDDTCMEQSPSREANRSSATQEIPRKFITALTRACDLSLSSARSILSMPLIALIFQVVTFTQVSSLKPCMHLSLPPYVLYALPISVFFIPSPE